MKSTLHDSPPGVLICLLTTGLALLAAGIPRLHAQQLAPAEPGTTDTAVREGLPIIAIQFKGQNQLSEQKLRAMVQTRPDRAFESRLVQADVRRLFNSGLVRDVRVLTRRSGGGLVVIFEIFERPTIASVRFIGNRGIDDKKLTKEASLEIGGALNSYAVEDGRRRLQELYKEKGFPQATVVIREGIEAGERDVVYSISEGYRQKIDSVRFVGNNPDLVTEARLRTQVNASPGWLGGLYGGHVDYLKIEKDAERITAYYRSLGFFQTRVGRQLDFDESGQWLTITYVIDEGPRYRVRSLQIQGQQVFDTTALKQQLELTAGDYFNLGKMNRGVTKIKDLYGMYGYIYARVIPDPRFTEEPGELDLFFNIKEGEQFRVGKINVHVDGEVTHTRQDVILNRLAFTPGDLINSRKVRTAERLLKRSQLFINNPALGTPPKIVIQPPRMTPDVPRIARPPEGDTEEGTDPNSDSSSKNDTVRGQSPSTSGNTIDRGSLWQPLEPFLSRGNQ
ncbi:MAG: POTRA domain-containing protein [Planctomycetota bacterium]|nr:POTRA domain-containing protein [Planctomycetota bacterium]